MARARSLLPQTIRKTIVAATVRNVRAFVFSVHTARVAQAATKAVSVRKVSEPDCCKTIIIQAISPVSRVVIVRASTAVTTLRVAISLASRAVIVRATTAVIMPRVAISRVSRAVIVRVTTAVTMPRVAISLASRVVTVRASTAVTTLRVAISRVSRAVIVLATTVVTTLRVAISRVRAVISSVAHVLSAVAITRTISREAIVSVPPITIRMLSTA